jgi:hypothetical protein
MAVTQANIKKTPSDYQKFELDGRSALVDCRGGIYAVLGTIDPTLPIEEQMSSIKPVINPEQKYNLTEILRSKSGTRHGGAYSMLVVFATESTV